MNLARVAGRLNAMSIRRRNCRRYYRSRGRRQIQAALIAIGRRRDATKRGTQKADVVAAACRKLAAERDDLRDTDTLDSSSPLWWLHTAYMKKGRGTTSEAIDARVKAQAGLRDEVKLAWTQGVWEILKIKAGRVKGYVLDRRKPEKAKSSRTGSVAKRSDEGSALGCRTEAHAADELPPAPAARAAAPKMSPKKKAMKKKQAQRRSRRGGG